MGLSRKIQVALDENFFRNNFSWDFIQILWKFERNMITQFSLTFVVSFFLSFFSLYNSSNKRRKLMFFLKLFYSYPRRGERYFLNFQTCLDTSANVRFDARVHRKGSKAVLPNPVYACVCCIVLLFGCTQIGSRYQRNYF